MNNLIKHAIKSRLLVLNSFESKDSVEDAIFAVERVNDQDRMVMILVPYIGPGDTSDKDYLAQSVIGKIVDKSLFADSGIRHEDFYLVMFFSFDLINCVDNCFVVDMLGQSLELRCINLSGECVMTKALPWPA